MDWIFVTALSLSLLRAEFWVAGSGPRASKVFAAAKKKVEKKTEGQNADYSEKKEKKKKPKK